MNRRTLLIIAIIVVAAIGAAAFMISSLSGNDNDGGADESKLDILGNGTIKENGTLNVKLSNGEGVALKDKEIHVSVKDSDGNVVFEKSAKTYVNGVANFKIENVSAGEYEVNATFDGDDNHTAVSASKKLVIEEAEDTEDDGSSDADAASGDAGSSAQSSSSSSYRYSPSQSSSSNVQPDSGSQDSSSSDVEPAPVEPVDGGGGETPSDGQN